MIRDEYASGDAVAATLAVRYDVSIPTIFDVIKGKTWKHTGGRVDKPPKYNKGFNPFEEITTILDNYQGKQNLVGIKIA